MQFQLNTRLDIAGLIKSRCQRAYATCASQKDRKAGDSQVASVASAIIAVYTN